MLALLWMKVDGINVGLANEKNAFKLYYGERSPWWLTLIAKGNAGR